MGYALDLRVTAQLDDLVQALTHPALAVDELDPAVQEDLPERVAANWELLATTVADAIADGGGMPDGALIDYVIAVIAHHTHSWLPLDYSSASGDWFRNDLIGTHVAGLVGSDAAADLLRRPLAGLVPPDLPAWGHLSADQVAAIASADPTVPDDHPEHATLRDLVGVLNRAARMGCAIVTIHA